MFYNDKVIYSVNNTTHIGNQYHKLGDMIRFTEPSSGQFLEQSGGTYWYIVCALAECTTTLFEELA